jgi:hypothetical protein
MLSGKPLSDGVFERPLYEVGSLRLSVDSDAGAPMETRSPLR